MLGNLEQGGGRDGMGGNRRGGGNMRGDRGGGFGQRGGGGFGGGMFGGGGGLPDRFQRRSGVRQQANPNMQALGSIARRRDI
jgi:hypothetical protein